ncbi:HET-domain-containing protein, partial [Setomelanomma holmii]
IMFHDEMRRWQTATRRRMARQFRVHFLAKLWVRSKRLRDLKTIHIRWRLQHAHRMRRPLQVREIRLLQVQPGNILSTISCDFLYVDLKSAKDYAALSYTWGSAAPTIPILLHGKVTLVSENLYLALLHLRKRSVELIWVDALCINQEDLAERARQVSHMDEVYRRASLVWVWLGDSDPFSGLAFDGLHSLGQHLDWDGAVPQRHLEKELDRHPQRWRAISELLYRPWFRRMWIIQEVLSARRAIMICGEDVIELDLFLKIIYSLFKAEMLKSVLAFHPKRHELSGGPLKVVLDQLGFFVKAKFHITDFLARHEFKKTLLNFMAETRLAEATNPLDKIYGIFSLAIDARSLGYWHSSEGKRSPRRPFEIDYTLTKEELFIRVTKAIICTSRSFEILRFARYEPNSANDLPSWVADWANPKPHIVLNYLPVESIDRNKSNSWRPVPRVSEASQDSYLLNAIAYEITKRCGAYFEIGHQNTLTIKGIHVDTIARLSSRTFPQDHNLFSFDPQNANITENMTNWQHYLESLKIWSEECIRYAKACDPYPSGQSISSALWSVLNGHDARTEDQVPHGCLALPRAIEDLQVAAGAIESQIRSKHVDALSGVLRATALSSFIHCLSQLPKMSKTCFAQKFATTQKRYMGLMPDGAKVGDLICVIYGCETPVVLRDCENGSFKLIGHGTVHRFDFDDAVVESTFTHRRGARSSRKAFTFTTWDQAGRVVYTLLKETRTFTLV